MSDTLRLLMAVAAVVTVIWIFRKIRKFKVKMEDAIFWTFFGGVLLILALVPEISFRLSALLGFISPSNFIFIVVIFLLTEKIFTLSIIVSQLEDKISVLSAELALRSHSADKRMENNVPDPDAETEGVSARSADSGSPGSPAVSGKKKKR